MKAKLKGLCKSIWYKLRKWNTIMFDGVPGLEGTARINLRDGIAKFGQNLHMKSNSYFAIVNGGRLTVGNGVSMNRNSIVVCHDSITIGDHCAIAPNVAIYDHDHKYSTEGLDSGFNTAPVVIERNCWIGAGVIILRGSHIGEGSVIGAGCVVKGKIPSHSLVTSGRELIIRPIKDKSAK